jgi:hypothetical protein
MTNIPPAWIMANIRAIWITATPSSAERHGKSHAASAGDFWLGGLSAVEWRELSPADARLVLSERG